LFERSGVGDKTGHEQSFSKQDTGATASVSNTSPKSILINPPFAIAFSSIAPAPYGLAAPARLVVAEVAA
jgi:hypothetical protein